MTLVGVAGGSGRAGYWTAYADNGNSNVKVGVGEGTNLIVVVGPIAPRKAASYVI